MKQTRRRSSTRATTPAAEQAPAEEPAAEAPADEPAAEAGADGETEPHVEHVPVKKKGGARKR